MNRQEKYRNGVLSGRGIQWTDATMNPISGCQHACRWTMPDGSIAICYAEEVAEGVARGAYPHGFAHHDWHPDRLNAPAGLKEPGKIFLDSMSDAFGRWVPEEQTRAILEMCRRFPQHTFQSLTKAAPRLLQFTPFPSNLWVGVSSPPDQMLGHHLTHAQQAKMLARTLETLTEVRRRQPELVTWISFEPLSWDVSEIVALYPEALKWAVVGAATNGPMVYQPDPAHVEALLQVLDSQEVPVFFKGNLWHNAAAPAATWREFFPGYVPSKWQGVIRAGQLDAHTPSKTPVRLADAQRVNLQGELFGEVR